MIMTAVCKARVMCERFPRENKNAMLSSLLFLDNE
jgi:hypothetical protein